MMNTSHNVTPPILELDIDDPGELQQYEFIIFLTNIMACSVSIVCNLIVLVLICQRRLLGRTTNVFVFSLAMADVVLCCGSLPYNVMLILHRDMSVYLCKGYFYALCVSRTAVSYTVVLLTAEKILNILSPSRFITAGRCMFFMTLVWFFSTSYNVWTVVFYTVYKGDTTKPEVQQLFLANPAKEMYGKKCFFSKRFESLKVIFLCLDLCILFVIPLLIIVSQFVMIAKKADGTIKQRFETYCYIMRFLIFICIAYVICHTPFEVSTMVKNLHEEVPYSVSIAYELSTMLYNLRGTCNLAIYGYFKQYVCKRRRRLSNSASCRTHLELPERRKRCREFTAPEILVLK